MKIAVVKLGARISFNANDTSGGNGEARSIIKMLHLGGVEVHIFTKILKKDNLLAEYKWHDLQDTEATLLKACNQSSDVFDALIVLNGSVNFFGGQCDPEQLLNYTFINTFPGKIFYIYCDPELTLKQVWPSVQKKPWGDQWSENALNITRNDIIYLSQPLDVKRIKNDLKGNEIIPEKIIHFPFEKFPLLNPTLPININPEVDLSYGGTMRGGKRAKKMVKYYFGHPSDISVEMFGKITLEDFDSKLANGLRTPFFSPSIRYDEMLPKMNKTMSHCVIGDPYYEQIGDMSQRCYESINSSVVTFIDSDMDKEKRVYGSDPILSEFLYVSSKDELSEKIQILKSEPDLRLQIINDQFKAVNFDSGKYCKSFVTLIENNL